LSLLKYLERRSESIDASTTSSSTLSSSVCEAEKIEKKIHKILNQIEDLKKKDASLRSEPERKKIASEKQMRDELALLLFIRVECICQQIDRTIPKKR